ncbi:MAG: 1-acylglycerol-3-phosphate O-acyltransferase [Gammaproteobacteria bacterium]|nr:1-acylglycerol-3-phosphate O-acyltransferase [Gammaproteobacteria bacterium]
MIAFVRIIFLVPIFILVCIAGCLYCLLRPFHSNNTHVCAGMLSKLAPLLGIKMVIRVPENLEYMPRVFIGNHQNTYDLVTISAAVLEGTVSIGKKSIKWIPFFGQLYWLAGNILIDRKNKTRAAGTINQTAERMVKDKLSIWMFPEGTRSRGEGLLPFKTGAFHTAIIAQVPIIPVVLSSTKDFSLNRWNNGYAIVEMMDPVATEQYDKKSVRKLADHCHSLMSDKLEALDQQVNELNLPKS